MLSLRTLFRVAVMAGVLVVVVKGWHLYGPSRDQVTSMAVRAIELGDSVLAKFRQASVNPRVAAAPLVGAPAPAPPFAQPLPPTTIAPPAGDVALASATLPATPTAPHVDAGDARIEAALARLQQLGAGEHQLQPWGSGGRLYRFCCSAAWGGAPGYSRHFEAVAAEPLSAVEQVVDQVAAWRAAQQGAGRLQ